MNQSYHKVPKGTTPAATFSQKWGDDPFTELGHTQTPNALIRYAVRLKLTPDECWLITCILSFKHSADHPYPSQPTLAALFGRSVDTVQRISKSLELKGVLKIDRERDELGHYSHIVYNFTPLRVALNECYYQDHPEKRPAYSGKPAIPHGCGPADGKRPNSPQTARVRHRKNGPRHTAKTALAIPHGCGPNQTLEKEKIKEIAAPPPRVYHSVIDEEKDRLRRRGSLTEQELISLGRRVGYIVLLQEMSGRMEAKAKDGLPTEEMLRVYRAVEAAAKKAGAA